MAARPANVITDAAGIGKGFTWFYVWGVFLGLGRGFWGFRPGFWGLGAFYKPLYKSRILSKNGFKYCLMYPYTAMKAVENMVGGAGAARPEQGGPAPKGARVAVEISARTLYGKDGEILDMLVPLFQRIGWDNFAVDESTLIPIKSDVWGSWQMIIKAHAFVDSKRIAIVGVVGFNGKTFAYFEEAGE
jgi:hypothetical protein